MKHEADLRLATYGTLAPGKPNQHVLADFQGRWSTGYVKGNLIQTGWASKLGFPAIVLDPRGGMVIVDLFESTALLSFWDQLDAFEGNDYQRVLCKVHSEGRGVDAWIYVARTK